MTPSTEANPFADTQPLSGTCPNCSATVSADAEQCLQCGAIFNAIDSWKPVPAGWVEETAPGALYGLCFVVAQSLALPVLFALAMYAIRVTTGFPKGPGLLFSAALWDLVRFGLASFLPFVAVTVGFWFFYLSRQRLPPGKWRSGWFGWGAFFFALYFVANFIVGPLFALVLVPFLLLPSFLFSAIGSVLLAIALAGAKPARVQHDERAAQR